MKWNKKSKTVTFNAFTILYIQISKCRTYNIRPIHRFYPLKNIKQTSPLRKRIHQNHSTRESHETYSYPWRLWPFQNVCSRKNALIPFIERLHTVCLCTLHMVCCMWSAKKIAHDVPYTGRVQNTPIVNVCMRTLYTLAYTNLTTYCH